MENISRWLEAKIVPVAVKLGTNRFLAAIRDAFILTFPITMAASIVALINSLILSTDGLIAKLLFLPRFFPNLNEAQQLFSTISNGTLSIMSIFITFLVADRLAKSHKGDSLMAGMVAIAAFFIIYPVPQLLEAGSFMKTDFLGARGLFTAMIIGCLVGEFLPKLSANRKLQIKMPEMVPPAVSRSFTQLIPVLLIILSSATVSFIFNLFAKDGLNEVIYTFIQTPLRNMGGNIFGVYVITFLIGVLWFFGIHGPATLNPVITAMFGEQNIDNAQHVLNGQPLSTLPHTNTYGLLSGVYGYMGGAGMTLALVIAIVLFSKRPDYKEVGRLGFIPNLFNINEPVVFGLPLVLNPIMAIPFIFAPIVSITIAYLSVSVFHIVPPAGIEVAWTMPGPLMAFLGTGGSWQGLILGLVCLFAGILVYLPFIKVADVMYAKEELKKKSAPDTH